MKARDWINLKFVDFNDPRETRKLKKGDMFLYGKNMKTQKENKKMGDMVSYYVVIDVKKNGNIEYILKNSILEEK